jgi:hypothetical protein
MTLKILLLSEGCVKGISHFKPLYHFLHARKSPQTEVKKCVSKIELFDDIHLLRKSREIIMGNPMRLYLFLCTHVFRLGIYKKQHVLI